jgi:hypothetical protein
MSEWAGRYPDPRGLSSEQRVQLLARLQRDRAAIDAAQARLLAAIDPNPTAAHDALGELDKHWDREEVAVVLKLSSGTARSIMLEARDLVHRFPAALALLEAGRITSAMTRRLVEACRTLTDEAAAAVEERVLKRAAQHSLSQFAAALRRAVLALAPKESEQSHEDARAARRIGFTHQPDGTSDLWATGLQGSEAVAMEARIRELSGLWKTTHADDERSGDQREADALVALVLGQPEAIDGVTLRPAINVTVAASTLLGADEQPGDLDGYGAIPATVARALASDPTGTWRRLLTDEHQRIIDVSARTYRPPANIARVVRAQRPRCCFPGCRRRAVRCDLDHVLPWSAGGETSVANLQPLCSRHHHVKHEAGWSVRGAPDGATIWTSPSGHTYVRPPDELPIDTTTDATADKAA